MFPEEGKEDSLEYLLPVYGISAVVVSLFSFFIAYIVVGLKNSYGLDILNFAFVNLVSIGGVIWIIFFCIKNRHTLISLAQAISDFKAFGKPQGYDEFNKKINYFSKLHLVYITSGSLLYFIVFAPMHNYNCEKLNAKKNLTQVCSLFVPLHVPYFKDSDLGKYPTIYIINTILFLIIIYIYTICGTVVWINLEMVEYIRFRIRHLKSTMLIAFGKPDKDARRVLFCQAMKYHEEILRMARLADNFFGTELFLHVVLTGAILGVSAFVMMDTQTIEVLMVFVGWLNAIIMGCVSGQRLINEASTIPDILYKVDWYNFDNGLKKDIVFFLLRCKKPMYIIAGNVIMTNALIIEILRTSYSYLTFLSSIGK